MTQGPSPRPAPGESELVITRVLDAPRALVFKAWTEPEHLKHWWGPAGWTLTVCEVDLRPGGVWFYGMRGSGGEESWGRAVYREIVVPERIVYIDSFSDAHGNPVAPADIGLSAGWPTEMLVTVTFAEQDGKTTLTCRVTAGTAPAAEREMVQQGWSETLDQLASYVTSV